MEFNKTGNEKLGSNCVVNSRAVGDTCPDSCHYLGNGCYAEAIEKRFPKSRDLGLRNVITDAGRLRAMILYSIKSGKSIRIHERGDFFQNGEIDQQYLSDWIEALESVKSDGHDPGDIWVYTHIYDSQIAELEKYGVNVYASLHSESDMEKARLAGFTKYAYCSTIKKKRGGSKDAPKFMDWNGEHFLVCPEQRMGRKRVTCTGGKQTTACMWCVKGKGNVMFLDH